MEQRVVLYATTGNAWPSAQKITISFEPDGTNVAGQSSNLFSTFNGNPNLSGWQAEIMRAAQVWAQVTNINFVFVTDDGTVSGGGSYQQGASNFGDIRIGGYNFNDSSLAAAVMPPPVNNYSIAGDIMINTGAAFGIGTSYDLFTVAVHEFGHALGLDHTTASSAAQMWQYYTGQKTSLHTDDIAGIRNIYSNNAARSQDSYDAASSNNTIGNATVITSELNKDDKNLIIGGLDITTTSDVDYYKVKLPRWVASTMVVRVQTTGLSMMTPKLSVYGENQVTMLGSSTGTGAYGETISVTINGVGNNDVYYFKVEGANATAFGTGAYGLTIDLGASTTPVVPSPNTQLANGSPLHSGGGSPDTFIEDTVFNTEPPTVPAVTQLPSSIKSPVLQGTGDAGSLVTVFEDGIALATAEVDSDGNWSITLPSSVGTGEHDLTILGTDIFGGNATVAQTFSIVLRKGRHK